jgi:hypothetical protein
MMTLDEKCVTELKSGRKTSFTKSSRVDWQRSAELGPLRRLVRNYVLFHSSRNGISNLTLLNSLRQRQWLIQKRSAIAAPSSSMHSSFTAPVLFLHPRAWKG